MHPNIISVSVLHFCLVVVQWHLQSSSQSNYIIFWGPSEKNTSYVKCIEESGCCVWFMSDFIMVQLSFWSFWNNTALLLLPQLPHTTPLLHGTDCTLINSFSPRIKQYLYIFTGIYLGGSYIRICCPRHSHMGTLLSSVHTTNQSSILTSSPTM